MQKADSTQITMMYSIFVDDKKQIKKTKIDNTNNLMVYTECGRI